MCIYVQSTLNAIYSPTRQCVYKFPCPNKYETIVLYFCSVNYRFFFLAASLAIFSCLAMAASTPIPPKTKLTPSHCIWVRRWPKATTDRIMVNILRVTVTVTNSTDENVDNV